MAIADNALTRERDVPFRKFMWRPLPRRVRDIHEKLVVSGCPPALAMTTEKDQRIVLRHDSH
jgi:hypothetical protein